LVDRCDAFVDARLPAEPVAPQTFSDFDTISGWSGVRLARCVDGPREPDRASDLLAWVIASESRWRCPHPLTGAIENDLGLAHGLAGMLAALALTLESPDDSTRESMHERAWFLARRGIEVRGVLAWPPTVQADRRERYRGAWCYGAPGVLAALYQTALFLRDVNLEVLVLGQFIRAAELSSYDLMLDCDAICHGTSGAALIFASAAAASGLAALGAAAERFVTELLDRLERSGGRCMVPSDESGAEHASYGLLTGVAGAILTLLTLTGDAGASWMRAHAIQPIR
jgi:lantibiotic modifying enzyme